MKAIIFDFDGTMLDTETPWYEAYREIYKEYGEELPMDVFVQCVGTSLDHFDPLTYLEQKTGRTLDREALRPKLSAFHAKRMAEQDLRPGVLNLIKAAEAEEYRLGIASSSHLNWVEPFLKRFGILDKFDFISTADRVEKVKPDPALYRLALSGLKVSAADAVAVEDSAHGAAAAVEAGIRCVVVPNPVTAQSPFPKDVIRWPTLEGRTLSDLFDV